MNEEKWVSDSDMEDIAGGAGKKDASMGKKGKGSQDGKGDAGLPGAGSGPFKVDDGSGGKGKDTKPGMPGMSK